MGRESRLPRRATPVDDDWRLLMAFLGVWKAGVRDAEERGQCFRNAEVAAVCLTALGLQIEPVKVYIEVERWPPRFPFTVLGCSPLTHRGQPEAGSGPWLGHLVLIVNRRWLVDVSTGQFNSPSDGFDVPPCLACEWTPGAKKQHVRVRNVAVTYWAAPDDGDDWRVWWEPSDAAACLNLQPLIEATRAAHET